MYEKVNPSHPDKVADRIAGALVDLAYSKNKNPKIAVEVLIGHNSCHVIAETSEKIGTVSVTNIVHRIAGEGFSVDYVEVPQDAHLAENQRDVMKCGDNGIFLGVPVTDEQDDLSELARRIYAKWPTDGKYLVHNGRVVICQSNADSNELSEFVPGAVVNPLGEWTGGPNVDTGATNRKIGSDMADSATGGGLHGKDLSKADVSVNIYAFLRAQETGQRVELSCAIGDTDVCGVPFEYIARIARAYIDCIGGFEKLAEWGLV